MQTTMRNGFLAVAAAMIVACGGASTGAEESAEDWPRSTARTVRRIPTIPTKPAPDDCTKPGDPNPGGSCWWGGEGSDSSCKDESVWKQYASDACSAKGAQITNLVFGESCNGGFRYAKYECCSADPKDPGPVPPKGSGRSGRVQLRLRQQCVSVGGRVER